MQTRFKLYSLINYLFLTLIILSIGGCTSDLEDERFELIPGTFPKLVDVPDRPIHPSMSVFDDLQQKLIKDREEANKAKDKNFEQLAPTSK